MSIPVVPGKLALKGKPLPTLNKPAKRATKRKAEDLTVAVVPEVLVKSEEKAKEKEKAVDPRTPAERAYDAEMQARAQQKARRIAEKSYRERIDEFNAKVATLSEHHDIPRVGPG